MDRVELTAAVLAGGQNRRLAEEKSLLKVGDKTLIETNITLLDSIFRETIIVSGKQILKERFPNHQFCSDLFPRSGPLAGIHTALKTASCDAVFVFACDMPNLSGKVIREMLFQYSLAEKKMFLVPSHFKGLEPLHAIYHKNCLPVIEKQLTESIFKISSFLAKVEGSRFNVSPDWLSAFFNINTKDDWQQYSLSLAANSDRV
jgi:molybdopterin-guanine dinucleotide biosynthesis protein A